MTGNESDTTPSQPATGQEETEGMTVLDAISLAHHFHREGNLEYARQIYEQLLAQFPNDADCLHFLGVLEVQTGKIDEGERLILASLGQAPDYIDALNSLGNIYRKKEDYPAAERVYRRICDINPNFPQAHLNLAALYYETDNFEQAIVESRTAAKLSPEMYESYIVEGRSHQELNRDEEAAISYFKAVKQEKYFRIGHFANLARALLGLGRTAEAIDTYRRWVELAPNDPKPKYHLAALTGVDVPPRSPDDYLKATFNDFAESFDECLGQIKYAVPNRIAELLKIEFNEQQPQWDVLDAGCGTGLGAAGVRPYARHLTGVDISKKMLEKARERNLYDDLQELELTKYVSEHPAAFDLIVSSDTLIYFGDLEEILVAMFKALRPNGRLIISVEKGNEGESDNGYLIRPHGRYAHTETYLREILRRAGFADSSFEELIIRLERGQPQVGFIIICQRHD